MIFCPTERLFFIIDSQDWLFEKIVQLDILAYSHLVVWISASFVMIFLVTSEY